ncbi:Asp-tRNA(Asn)/Glu-tRNA(Gln) amidotransferase subunit GatA [Mucilaginibacter arboris]|uniref:Glutamyl-tRNA(Gln) amidotransferase subunit A n=1 Tax=Mucilaginibacter arboris TaxID=2682090 RepID=A0A7K1SRL3_9SPHI|nr:Asp-tRNA(Asn)/Glu-tRNA(Gln) amidotransferase subunit GatA [Mucilaginibacter arboris]MVN19966.1 Asp-tRNA(Asn)/Glu-tRNA(Gln) amidotransferase subunit GatA [Mucilaginibacter arboris]
MKFYSSLKEVQDDLRNDKITVVSLVQYYLDRINQHKNLNAFNEVFDEEALRNASFIDQKLKEGKAGRLAGMIIGIKDNICYKGHQVSASSRILEGFTSVYSATVIERLLAEDVIIIGRCNCDEFAMGGSNETSYYGPVKNFKDIKRVSGGSSGGSAVAVQADLCLAALGTDTGGSVRQPCSFCGVIGLKPTYGRISRHGIIAYASSFDQVGPITRSVEDSALLLEVLAGSDDYDSTAALNPVPSYSASLKTTGKKSIAYIQEILESEGVDQEIKDLMRKKIEQLQADGHVVEPVSFAYLDYVVPTYYVLTTAEASSNLSRFDGVHYGYRSPNATDTETIYTKTRTEGFGEEVKRRIMLGTFVLSSGYYDAYYAKAQKVRRLIKNKTDEILRKYDFILTPTTPTAAFNIGEIVKDPIVMYLEDIFTVQASLAGIPAISLPAGNNAQGLPLGLQLLAPAFAEGDLLNFSAYFLKLA